MDVSKLSNEDLLALHNKQYDKLSNEGLMALHGQSQPKAPEPQAGVAQNSPGLIEKGLSLIPGMKERYDKIHAFRDTPEYKSEHPSPVTGMEDPVYQYGVGLAGPESLASMFKSVGKFFAPAAQRSEVLSKVKNVGELEPYVQGKINEASEMFNKKQIGPRMLEQNARAENQIVPIDVSKIRGIHPEVDQILAQAEEASLKQPYSAGADNLSLSSSEGGGLTSKPFPEIPSKTHGPGEDFYNQIGNAEFKGIPEKVNLPDTMYPKSSSWSPSVKSNYNKSGVSNQTPIKSNTDMYPKSSNWEPSSKTPYSSLGSKPASSIEKSQMYSSESPEAVINLPMKEVLDIRRKLNSVTPRFDDPTFKDKVLNAGNYVRGSLSKVDPSIEPLSKELQDAYAVQKQALGNANRNPVTSIVQNQGATGLAKRSRLARFDEQAGSDLSTLGKNIKTANDRSRPLSLTDLFSIQGPKQIANKLSAPVLNAYDEFALKQLLAPKASGAQKLRGFGQKSSIVDGE